MRSCFFFFQAEDGIRDSSVTGVQTCALPISLADPALLGKMTILEGKVNFAGTDYVINRGEIHFLNPFKIDPVISMDVSTRKQQFDISLDFAGPLDNLRVNYRSDPPLPVPDIQLL